MQRDFCLYCGAPLSTGRCNCSASPQLLAELERRERDHLSKFAQAWPLTMRDMGERVRTENGSVLVAQLLSELTHPNAIRELGVRRTDREVVQLVYEKHHGSRVYRWRLE